MTRTLASRQKFWVAVAGIGAVVAIGIGANVFGVRSIQRDWTVSADAWRRLTTLEQVEREAVDAERVFAGLAHERALIDAGYADPTNPLPFIETIEGLGRRVGVTVEISLAGGTGDYALRVAGPYRSAITFLQTIEYLPFFIQMGDVKISRASAQPTTTGAKQSEPSIEIVFKVRIVEP